MANIPKFSLRILPVAAFYGANASGKTNLLKAFDFVKEFVVKGWAPEKVIGVEPYNLDSTSRYKSTRFSMELLIKKMVYEFIFTVTQKAVTE